MTIERPAELGIILWKPLVNIHDVFSVIWITAMLLQYVWPKQCKILNFRTEFYYNTKQSYMLDACDMIIDISSHFIDHHSINSINVY